MTYLPEKNTKLTTFQAVLPPSEINIWLFPSMVVPPKHPKMIIFSRKTHGCWVPPFQETPISFQKPPYSLFEVFFFSLEKFDQNFGRSHPVNTFWALMVVSQKDPAHYSLWMNPSELLVGNYYLSRKKNLTSNHHHRYLVRNYLKPHQK